MHWFNLSIFCFFIFSSILFFGCYFLLLFFFINSDFLSSLFFRLGVKYIADSSWTVDVSIYHNNKTADRRGGRSRSRRGIGMYRGMGRRRRGSVKSGKRSTMSIRSSCRSISASDKVHALVHCTPSYYPPPLPPALLVCIPPSPINSDGARVIHLHIRQQIDIDTKQAREREREWESKSKRERESTSHGTPAERKRERERARERESAFNCCQFTV